MSDVARLLQHSGHLPSCPGLISASCNRRKMARGHGRPARVRRIGPLQESVPKQAGRLFSLEEPNPFQNHQ